MAIEVSNGARRLRPTLPPVALALLAQCLSVMVVLSVVLALSRFTRLDLPLAALALMQGVVAAAVSRRLKLAIWWLAMQMVLPVALLAALSLHVPSTIYLAAFLLLLALYWTTFRTQVPFYPSGPATWRAVADLLPQCRPVRVVDIGSGFGGLALHLAARRSDSFMIGVEVAPLPWAISRLRAALTHSRAVFARTDYNRLHFGEYDVVFAYLSPAAMPALWEKARAEMRPGSLLLSYEFAIPGVESQIANICGAGDTILYGWNI